MNMRVLLTITLLLFTIAAITNYIIGYEYIFDYIDLHFSVYNVNLQYLLLDEYPC